MIAVRPRRTWARCQPRKHAGRERGSRDLAAVAQAAARAYPFRRNRVSGQAATDMGHEDRRWRWFERSKVARSKGFDAPPVDLGGLCRGRPGRDHGCDGTETSSFCDCSRAVFVRSAIAAFFGAAFAAGPRWPMSWSAWPRSRLRWDGNVFVLRLLTGRVRAFRARGIPRGRDCCGARWPMSWSA